MSLNKDQAEEYTSMASAGSSLSSQPRNSAEVLATNELEPNEKPTDQPAGEAATPEDAPEEPFKPSRRTMAALSVYMLLTILVAIDATAVGVPLPVITADLHGSTTQAVWTGSAYLLTSAVFQPIIGSLSEIFGRMPLTMMSTAIFAVGSIVCAVSHNFSTLLAGRAVQGFGGGGIIVLTEIIVTDLFPLRERGKYFGLIGGMWALGTVVGPILGGGFASGSASWRWVFYFNLPFCGVSLVLIPLLLRLNLPELSLKEKFKRIDYFGIALFICSATSVLLGITFGGVLFPWKSANVLVPLVLGFAGLIAFGFYEAFVAKDPMMRLAVFSTRSALLAYVQVMFHGLILWCTIYFLPLYYEGVKGYKPIIAGLALMPESLAIAPAAIITGLLITNLGRYVFLSWIAWCLMTFGCGLLYLLKVDTTVGQWIGLNIPYSIGAGILFASLNLSVIAPNTNENTPYAAAMLSFLRVMGQAFGVAIGGSVFANQMSSKLAANPELAQFGTNSQAIALIEVIKELPPSSTRDALILAFDDSIRIIFIVLIAFSGLSFVLNILVKEYTLDVQYTSAQRIKDAKPKPASDA